MLVHWAHFEDVDHLLLGVGPAKVVADDGERRVLEEEAARLALAQEQDDLQVLVDDFEFRLPRAELGIRLHYEESHVQVIRQLHLFLLPVFDGTDRHFVSEPFVHESCNAVEVSLRGAKHLVRVL